MNRATIGIDVGGTKIAGGVLSWPDGRILATRVVPTDARRSGEAVLDEVQRLARRLENEAAALGSTADAMGIGICELVDREGRIASANCIHWLGLPVIERLSSIAPTVIEADVRAAALAETLFGAGQSLRSFLYVTVGTGISCCLMLDGAPHLGAHGVAGTMASNALSIPCESCGHVSRRTLEEISSGPALAARYRKAGGEAQSGQEVLAAAAEDQRAPEIIISASEALGSQIGLLVNVLDPEAVIIGGGLGLSEGLYSERLIAATRQHIWSDVNRPLPILRAATGENAAWIGAAARAGQHFQLQPFNLTRES